MNYRQRIFYMGFLDACIVAAAVLLAYFQRFDFQVRAQYFPMIPYVAAIEIALVLITFNWMKLYRRVWQYASIGEVVAIVKATTISGVIFFLLHHLLMLYFPTFIVPRSIYLSTWTLITLSTGGARFAWRLFRDSYFKIKPHHRRTLIVGAGSAGALVAKELKHSAMSELYPVGFADDDPSKARLEVIGLPVLGGRDRIPEIVERYEIDDIVIALPSASREETAKIIKICKDTKASIKILPRVSDLVTGKVSVNMIREVHVEDLLGRDPIETDLEGIANYVTDQVVLVTGAGGSIGSELCRQISPFEPRKLLLLGHGENSIYNIELELRQKFPKLLMETIIADIQDRERIREVFALHRPSVIFHAAAHKHVPLMECNPAEAIKNNVLGTKNVADCAHEFGTERFVMVSTDKAVNPTNVMGACKRVAEMYIQGKNRNSKTQYMAVRFGNVLGSRGSVIPIFKEQIRRGGPVTVTHPHMVRYFMTIPEAVQLVIQAGALADGGEIFILDMGEPVKIDTLARDLIRLSGFEPDKEIRIEYTGIRPGEKLYEELLTSEEGLTSTKHNRIFVGKPTDSIWDDLQFMIRKLEQVALKKETENRAQEIKELLKVAIPTYQFVSAPPPSTEREAALLEIQSALRETAATTGE
ncbi:MAG: polysaccharide biosynthesis protein [Tumebacillaceae bacterium]